MVRYQQFGSVQRAYNTGFNGTTGGSGGAMLATDYAGRDSNNGALTEPFRAKIAEWTQKLHILESFNGSYFFGLPGSTQATGAVTGTAFDAMIGQNATNDSEWRIAA